MNFQLFDLESFLSKKKELNSLGKPTLEKAYVNGLKDQTLLHSYRSYTHYERILRNNFQLQVNNNRLNHEPILLKETNRVKKEIKIKNAADDEFKIYKEYISYVEEYKRGLSREDATDSFTYEDLKKKREVKTELVFCFDASFGMYHISLFQAINKFIDLLSSIELEQTDVAIISYGYGTNMVSQFSSNKAKLLLKTAMMLPASGVNIIYDNFKLSAISDNDLDSALRKTQSLFFNSVNASKSINRHVVILSDGNLSGVVGSDSTSYDIDKEYRNKENLDLVLLEKKRLSDKAIKVSSISLRDGTNIIGELSKIIFWEESVIKINIGKNTQIEGEEKENMSQIDMNSYEKKLQGIMKLNLYYIQQEQLKKGQNVYMD